MGQVTHGEAEGPALSEIRRVFVALVGGMLIASTVLQLYAAYQDSQNTLLRVESVEASSAALRISQFVEGIRTELRAVGAPPGLSDVPLDRRELDFFSLQNRASAIEEHPAPCDRDLALTISPALTLRN